MKSTSSKSKQYGIFDKIKNEISNYFFRLPICEINDIVPSNDYHFDIIDEERNLPPRPDAGWMTNEGKEIHLDHDDITPLLRIVQYFQPKCILEIGTAWGNTTANICKISTGKIFTVNALPEQIADQTSSFALTKEMIGSVYRKYGFDNRVTQIYENTLNFDHKKYFQSACVDLAIIDACHEAEYVINDFDKVLPVLSQNAIVLFHDTHPSRIGHLKGSYQACMDLRRQGYNIKYIKDTWWGIWQKN